jgi:hypothetical protein
VVLSPLPLPVHPKVVLSPLAVVEVGGEVEGAGPAHGVALASVNYRARLTTMSGNRMNKNAILPHIGCLQ